MFGEVSACSARHVEDDVTAEKTWKNLVVQGEWGNVKNMLLCRQCLLRATKNVFFHTQKIVNFSDQGDS